MIDSIKFFAKITGIAFLRWSIVMVLGLIFSAICFVVALTLLDSDLGSMPGARAGGVGVLVILIAIIISKFWPVLLLVSSFVFIVLYFIVANKISLSTAVYLVCEKKLLDYLKPKIVSYIKIVSERYPDWFKDNFSLVKKKFLQTIKSDKETPSIQKKVIKYGLKKITLDDVDFKQENVSFSEIMTKKILEKIAATAKPSFKSFYIVAGLQFLLLILVLFFNH